jgi:tetratricopeptide (TPR) repeat protein
VLGSDPESLEARTALARIAGEGGRFAEAALLLERALVIAPPDLAVELALELAEVAHARLREPERALAALWRGYELGDVARARAHFEATLALRPGDLEAASITDPPPSASLHAHTTRGDDERTQPRRRGEDAGVADEQDPADRRQRFAPGSQQAHHLRGG